MELQADLPLLPRSRHMVVSLEQHQNEENSPPFLVGRSETPFRALHFLKRQPLQEITHLFATNGNTQSIYNGRMSSVVEMRGLIEQTSSIGSKKRKPTNLLHGSNISSSSLKRPLLRRDFR